jgi:hypothetical protein
LYVMYMPMLRQEILQFVQVWNCHTIRPQNQRPYLPTGQPVWLFQNPTPEKPDFAIPVDLNLVDKMIDKLRDYGNNLTQMLTSLVLIVTDPEEYLPSSTLSWCRERLTEAGYELSISQESILIDKELSVKKTQHFRAYRFLIMKIREHIERCNNLHPELKLTPSPTGSYEWIKRHEIQSYSSKSSTDNEIDIIGYAAEYVSADFNEYTGTPYVDALLQPDADNDFEDY